MFHKFIKRNQPSTITKHDLQQKGLELYTPPFSFSQGFIFDSKHHVLASDGVIVNLRGASRFQNVEYSEALQNHVGNMIVDALNEYWDREQKKLREGS